MHDHKLCFNDILLVPCYSELPSRTIPNVSTRIGRLQLKCPIVSSPMDSVTGARMLVTMDKLGGLGILTRYINMPDNEELDLQIKKVRWAKQQGAKNIGCAIGIQGNVYVKTMRLLEAGCGVICLDVAHGDHKKMYEAIKVVAELKDQYYFILMAGNICTPEAARRFVDHGVDAIKVGIGPGAACTTRIVTGCGYPQLAAIQECHSEIGAKYPDVAIIADGGIRNSGDMVKSLWAGADACMLGYLLAGTSAAPILDGKRIYRGMSSRMTSGRSDIAPEGIEIEVGFQGDTQEVLQDYTKGIQSGLAMVGANNIYELRKNVDAIMVTPLSREETLTKDY